MATEQEVEVYSYTLNIQSVKMKVKFACKMRLEAHGEFTSEVSQNESGKFIFNQEFTLKEDTDHHYFEIIAHLTTEKGAKYIAGVIRLVQNELVHQEGEMLVVPLSKCLDPEASCQLRVDQVSSEKVMKKVGLDKMMASRYREANRDFSPGKFQSSKTLKGTRSQFQFPLTTKIQRDEYGKPKEETQSIYHNNNNNRMGGSSFRKNNIGGTHLQRNHMDFTNDAANRDKLIEAEVYKESYQKLKEKYKRESQTAKHELNKRIALENAENNYKLDIMRLKMKCQEQDKALIEKNNRIKEFQGQLAGLQKKELDLQYLKEENSNKDHTIRMLEETIRTLNKDNEDLKNLNKQRFEGQQQKIKELRNQIESLKKNNQNKLIELEREMRNKTQIILQKQSEIRSKDERLEREQKLIGEMQKNAQNKMVEFQRALQAERNDGKMKMEDLKAIIHKLEKEKARLEEEIEEKKAENEKVKAYVIKIQYDKKIGLQESDGLKTELVELKIIKEKYQQLTREHRLLTEDKNHLQRQYEKSIQSKDTNISDLTKQHQEQIDHYKKIYREVDEKLKLNMNKNLQLETSLEQKKNQAEKYRKNNQNLTKELNNTKQSEKRLSKNLKEKEEQYNKLNGDMESFKYKFKNGDQMSKYEIQTLKEELNKLKKDYESESIKASQLAEKNFTLNSEVNNLKLKVQYAEDQAQKTSQLHRQKIQNMQQASKDLERKIQDLTHNMDNLRNIQKQNQQKIQSMEIGNLKSNEKKDQLQKEIRNLNEKLHHSENIIKNKQQEITQLQGVKEGVERRLAEIQQKLSSSKNNYNTLTGEKNKNEKIIQLLNKQISENKEEMEKMQKVIGEKEKNQGNLRNEIKKAKEEYLKLQMKFNGMKKQYEKFKENLIDTMSSSFAQIPIYSIGNSAQMKTSQVTVQIVGKKSSLESNQSNIMNSEIITKVSSQNKDIKLAMNRLIQQNKSLQKQIDCMNEQLNVHSGKAHNMENSLSQQIMSLEEQLQKIYIEKEEQAMTMGREIIELKEDLETKKENIGELEALIQENNFTINSLKMDEEAKSEHYNFKHNQYKSKINQLEQKVTFLSNNLEELEARANNLESNLSEKQEELERQRERVEKKNKEVQQLESEKNGLVHSNQEGKKYRKQLMEKISELELKFNTEVQMNEKSKQQLQEEQHKGSELKQFVSNLMKQKETAIKSDLEKSQQIIGLEGQIIELKRERDMGADENQRLKKSVEELKEVMKKMNGQIKDLQISEADQKLKNQKLAQNLKDSQRSLKQSQQNFDRFKEQAEKAAQKSNKKANQLQSQLQDLLKLKEGMSGDFSDRINDLSRQLRQAQSKISSLKSQILILQENLFTEKQNCQLKSQENIHLSDEVDKNRKQIKNLNEKINQMNEEIKDKEEDMFQMSGKIYNLEVKIENKEKEKNEKVQETIEDWSTKYDMICDEYEQRIQLIEKERDHFKERLDEKEEEFKKITTQLRNTELDDANFKKVLQDKVKRLEDDRLNIISSKNAQIQRFSEENKNSFEKIKAKEADLRRIQHQLEIARSTIAKLENNKKQTEDKIRHINKVYQGELEQLKKKEVSNRTTKEQLGRIQWDIERQIKKSVSSYSKKLISGESKEISQKIMAEMKGMEEEVILVITNKLSENAKA